MNNIQADAFSEFFYEYADFIITKDDKTPTQPFKNGINQYKYDQVKSENNLAIALKDNWVVIDVDNKDHPNASLKLMEVIEQYGWVCNIMQTSRGHHFWFKVNGQIANATNIVLPIGIRADIKTYNNSYVIVKHKGELRKWLQFSKKVDKLPLELTPIDKNAFQSLNTPVQMQEGERNNNLFARIYPLLQNYWNHKRIYNLLSNINRFLFAEPIADIEIETMLNSAIKSYKNNDANKDFYNVNAKTGAKSLDIQKVADYIIDTYKVIRYNNTLFFYDQIDNIFKIKTEHEILILIDILLPHLKPSEMKNIFQKIETSRKLVANAKEPEPNIIALNNCLYNLNTFRPMPFDDNLFIIHKINVEFQRTLVGEHYGRRLKKFLFDITSGIDENMQILLEFIGYCLTTDTKFQKTLLLYGPNAKNGKSTFLQLVEYFLNSSNVSHLGLGELNKRFAATSLIGKMANIGDDISTTHLNDPSTFKKLTTGEAVSTEYKGKERFSFKNTAKMIFATNKLPSTQDKTNGFFRRFLIVPFLNQFDKKYGNYDADILDKLCTKNNMSTLFNMVIKALKNLTINGEFTYSSYSESLVYDYIKNNNSVNGYIENDMTLNDEQIKQGEGFVNFTVIDKYNEYKRYCLDFGYKALSLTNFKDEVLLYFKDLNLVIRKTKENDLILEKFIRI
ncbi:transcriptional regulator [Mycoplasma bovis]|nr:transcriptional regulator [Mycoplasmopsis bovis]